MKKIITTLSFIFVLLFATLFVGCQSSDKDTFTKPIDTADLELNYTVYEGSRIWATVTPLVDIKNLNVTISCHQSNHILHQLSQSFEKDFLKKGDSFSYEFDISDTYPFDRVGLYNITGYKKESSDDLTEEKRVGIIKSPSENLSTELFNFRLDTSYAENTVIGRLCITSLIDLWDAEFWISYTDENSNRNYTQPNLKVDEVVANKEFYIKLGKLLGDDTKVKNLSIERVSGRTVEPIVVNGQ